MKKTITMLVLVGLLLGGTNAWMDNKIEKLEKELDQIVEESKVDVVITQDELIALAVRAGATDIIVEKDKIHYKLNGVRTTVYEAGYYYESLELSDN